MERWTREAAEEAVTLYCRRGRLSGLQTEAVLHHLVDGYNVQQIRLATEIRRVSEVRALLEAGLAKVCPLPGFREVLRHVVDPQQFRRLMPDDRDLTTEQAMRGPAASEPRRVFVGRTWIEMCYLPGTTTHGVPVRLAETLTRVG